jgi:glutathione S-transferase
MGDGIMDSAVERFCEIKFREPAQRSNLWVERHQSVADSALNYLEDAVETQLGGLNLGALAILAALGYLDHRFPGDQWRRTRPKLSAWFAAVSARPSFAATAP